MRGPLRQLTPGHIARITAALVLVAGTAVAVMAFHAGRDMHTFSACIGQKHFLVARTRRSGRRVIDRITDRATGVLEGEVAVLPSVRAAAMFTSSIGPPGGTGAANGRMILFTRIPYGRDANAILTCSLPEFPVTP